MDKMFVNLLSKIVGAQNVYSSEEERYCYGYDGSSDFYMPQLVVKPQNAEQAADIVKLANYNRYPVYPRGAGTGLYGGSLPALGGIAMVFTGMNKIIEIDQEKQIAVVESGVVTAHLREEAERRGLFYPPNPMSLDVSTIGGNIAEDAGGSYGASYGSTGDYVEKLEVITPTGDIILNDHDSTDLLIGSRGTFGIITKAWLRLLPKPEFTRTVLVVFDGPSPASDAAVAIYRAGITPSTLDIMDDEAIRCVRGLAGDVFPRERGTVLLIEVEGSAPGVDRDLNSIGEICLEQRASKVKRLNTSAERKIVWTARRGVYSSLLKLKPKRMFVNASVPRDNLPEIINRLEQIGKRYDLALIIFGHAGNGNLHPHIMFDDRDTMELAKVEKAREDIRLAVSELGGGFCERKKPADWQSIKKELDPDKILNPGKTYQGDMQI